MMHAHSMRLYAGISGTAILGAMAVLTLAGPREVAKDLVAEFGRAAVFGNMLFSRSYDAR
jgi:hypothetical protein